MKAILISERDKVEFVDIPKPALKPGHALIRPICLSLCASDVYMLHYAPDEDFPYPPGTTGHEMVGIVEAMDGEHPEVNVGDMTLTIAPEQSAMAEYYLAPFNNVLPVPKGVSPEQLVQAQQLGTVIYACQQLPNIVGKDVAVIGQGSAGLWFDVMLKRMGAHRVIGIDLLDHRLAVSPIFGATHVVNNSAENPISALKTILDGKLPDVVVEACGEDETINLAIDLTRDHGFILQFGVPHNEQIAYNYSALFRKCLTLKPIVFASREHRHLSTRIALDMIANEEVPVAPILTHRFPFSRVPEAYNLQRTREDGAIKIIVEMPT